MSFLIPLCFLAVCFFKLSLEQFLYSQCSHCWTASDFLLCWRWKSKSLLFQELKSHFWHFALIFLFGLIPWYVRLCLMRLFFKQLLYWQLSQVKRIPATLLLWWYCSKCFFEELKSHWWHFSSIFLFGLTRWYFILCFVRLLSKQLLYWQCSQLNSLPSMLLSWWNFSESLFEELNSHWWHFSSIFLFGLTSWNFVLCLRRLLSRQLLYWQCSQLNSLPSMLLLLWYFIDCEFNELKSHWRHFLCFWTGRGRRRS